MTTRSLQQTLLLIAILTISFALFPEPLDPSQAEVVHGPDPFTRLSISFSENAGQFDPSIHFVARMGRQALLLGHGHFTVVLDIGNEAENQEPRLVQMQFVGSEPTTTLSGEKILSARSHYLVGRDPENWVQNVRHFEQVRYRNLYPGIDLLFYSRNGQLEYDFIVSPGADPSKIELQVRGADDLKLDPNGDLRIRSDNLEFRQLRANVYQESTQGPIAVPAHYTTDKESVRFQLGDYARSEILVIDPVLTLSTYLGGERLDEGHAITVDEEGNIYVTGFTVSDEFPVFNPLPGFGEHATGSSNDVYVTKIDGSTGQLVYSTFVGGTGNETGYGIAVDGDGSAVVAGETSSRNFPSTQGSLQIECDGGSPVCSGDGFVFKLHPDGSAFEYSTFFGGDGGEVVFGMAMDETGNVHLTGRVSGSDLPLMNAFQTQPGGAFDAFLSKLNPSGSALIFSTYLGGSGDENLRSEVGDIAVDSNGNVYVTGQTDSDDFPTIPGAIQTTRAGELDVFVAKFDANGARIYSTYLGGTDDDRGFGIGADGAGNAYVTGETVSLSFPQVNPVQPRFGGARTDAFVSKLNPDGSELLYSTFLGGNQAEDASDIVVTEPGNAYVAGTTLSDDFPLLDSLKIAGPLDSRHAFVTQLDPTGQSLLSSTLYGSLERIGGGADGFAMALDPSGNIYLTGRTSTRTLPLIRAFQTELAGDVDRRDNFVARISSTAIRLFFAQFADGMGLFSQIILFNLDAQMEATAQVTLKDGDGDPMTVDLNGEEIEGRHFAVIPPSGLVVLATDGEGDLVAGSVTIESDKPLAGVILFGGTVGLAGVGNSQALEDGFTAPMEVRLDGETRLVDTGVAVMNLEMEEVELNLTLTDLDGNEIATASAELPPMGHLARFISRIDDWDPPVDFSSFKGTLMVTSTGRIAATVIQSRPGQFATLPVAPK